MSLRLRPRFDVLVKDAPAEAMARLEKALEAEGSPVSGNAFTLQYELEVTEHDRHTWSPFLNLLLEEGDDGTHLRGRFGPNASVWTMFVAAYTVLGLSGGIGLIVASSQWSIQQPATGLYVTVLTALLAVVVYVVGKVGEKLAQEDMERIRAYVETVFEVPIMFE